MTQKLSEQYLLALQKNGLYPPIEKIEADLIRFGIEELSQDYLEILASRCQEFRTPYADEYDEDLSDRTPSNVHMTAFETALRGQVAEEVREAVRVIQDKPDYFRVELVKSLSSPDKWHPDQMAQLEDRIVGTFNVLDYLQKDINNVGWVVFAIFIFTSIIGLGVALNVQQTSFAKQLKETNQEVQYLRSYRDSAERDALEKSNQGPAERSQNP